MKDGAKSLAYMKEFGWRVIYLILTGLKSSHD